MNKQNPEYIQGVKATISCLEAADINNVGFIKCALNNRVLDKEQRQKLVNALDYIYRANEIITAVKDQLKQQVE